MAILETEDRRTIFLWLILTCIYNSFSGAMTFQHVNCLRSGFIMNGFPFAYFRELKSYVQFGRNSWKDITRERYVEYCSVTVSNNKEKTDIHE